MLLHPLGPGCKFLLRHEAILPLRRRRLLRESPDSAVLKGPSPSGLSVRRGILSSERLLQDETVESNADIRELLDPSMFITGKLVGCIEFIGCGEGAECVAWARAVRDKCAKKFCLWKLAGVGGVAPGGRPGTGVT